MGRRGSVVGVVATNFPSSSSLAKTILQGTVKEGRSQGRQKKRWEDDIRVWTGLEASGEQRKMEETGCEASGVAPTTPTVKG